MSAEATIHYSIYKAVITDILRYSLAEKLMQ